MLLGRETELERIAALLAEARAGRGGVLVLHGEPGAGKTALLGEAEQRAAGLTVLRAQGVESEAELAYAALSSLLAPVLEHRAALPARQRAALEAALALGPPLGPDRFAVAAATLGLLGAAAAAGPLLALVDDAHRLDTASAGALRFAARRIGAAAVAMLVAVRAGEPAAFDASGLPVLPVAGLAPAPARALLARAAGPGVTEAVLDWAVATTGGTPLALVELPHLLTRDQLAGREPLPEPPPLAGDLAAAFRRRLEALPVPSRRALLVAAACDEPSAHRLAPALARLGERPEAFTPAQERGLIGLDGGVVAFRHPLLRSAVYHAADADERRRVHHALAEAADGPRRAWHLAAAALGPDEAVAAELERAAGEAMTRGAPAVAAATLDVAARLTPAPEPRLRRLADAARGFHLAGRPAPALALVERALADVDDPVARADLERLRCHVQLMVAATPEVRRALLAQAAKLEGRDVARAAVLYADAGWAATMAGDVRAALRLGRRAHALAEPLGDPPAALAALLLAVGLILDGQVVEGATLLRRAAPVTADPLLAATALPTAFAFYHLWALDDPEPGRTLLTGIVRALRADGALAALPFALAGLAQAELRRGDWSAALVLAEESAALAMDTDQTTELAYSLFTLALIEAGRGPAEDGREHGRRALEMAHASGAASVATLTESALGLLELGIGRPAVAGEHLERAGALAERHGLANPDVAPWAPDLVEAYVDAGRREDAEAVLTAFAHQAERAGLAAPLAAAARCRGMLAPPAEAARWFDRSLALHPRAARPFDRARTLLRRGDEDALREALAVFERLGAAPWAARARAALAARGAPPPPADDPLARVLTRAELTVAEQVATGARNHEIAAELFISPRTVESHLSHVYRKLGIRSRSELTRLVVARRLQDPPP